MDFEITLISFIFHKEIDINQYKFTKEMFKNKVNYEYIEHLQKNVSTADFDSLNQLFISKKQLNIYTDLSGIKQQYSVNTIIEMFYKAAIDNIWKVRKLENTSISVLSEMKDHIEFIKNLIYELQVNEKSNPFEKFRENITITQSKINSGEVEAGIVGLRSSLSELDIITGGFRPGEYIIIAGRPSMGKTSLALDIGVSAIKEGKSLLVLSLEMPAEDLIARMIPKINPSLSLENTMYGKELDDKMADIFAASAFLEQCRLEVEDFSTVNKVTSTEIVKRVEQYNTTHKCYPDLIILDYMQIIKGYEKQSETELTTEISSMMQRIGKKTKSVVIALSQLNRGLEERDNKRPLNSDLRSSGSLEQDADKIIFVYREAVYMARKLQEKLQKENKPEVANALRSLNDSISDAAEIILSKNRNGKLGTAIAHFHKSTASYVENLMIFDIEGF